MVFIGAAHGSNNTGELTAIGEVLRWVGTRVPAADERSLLIRYDSTYAAYVTQGIFRANSNKQLARTVQHYYRLVSAQRTVYFSHVKGHSDHKWNDYADKLANRGRTSSSRNKWEKQERIREANRQMEVWRRRQQGLFEVGEEETKTELYQEEHKEGSNEGNSN